jgi:hypothetical protein
MGIWTEIIPTRHRSREWQFAEYTEVPSERSDGQWYTAFLFKNRDRTLFGVREWLADGPPHRSILRKMAGQVIIDKTFRQSLLSERPDLVRLWKKR